MSDNNDRYLITRFDNDGVKLGSMTGFMSERGATLAASEESLGERIALVYFYNDPDIKNVRLLRVYVNGQEVGGK